MGLLDGGLARILTPVFASFYLDGLLHAGTGDPVYDGETGEIIGYEGGDLACKCQVDAATDAMRRAQGFAEGDVRLIVLAQDLPELNSDHEVSVSGSRYRLQSVDRDPVGSHWVCRGRKACPPLPATGSVRDGLGGEDRYFLPRNHDRRLTADQDRAEQRSNGVTAPFLAVHAAQGVLATAHSNGVEGDLELARLAAYRATGLPGDGAGDWRAARNDDLIAFLYIADGQEGELIANFDMLGRNLSLRRDDKAGARRHYPLRGRGSRLSRRNARNGQHAKCQCNSDLTHISPWVSNSPIRLVAYWHHSRKRRADG